MIVVNWLHVLCLIALNLLALVSIIVAFLFLMMFTGLVNAVCGHQVTMMELKEKEFRKHLGKEKTAMGLHKKGVENVQKK